jgi:protein-disulfide isomerase
MLLIVGFLLATASGQAFGDGLSREQGDVIISELRQIRQLLEKGQKADAAPAAPAPPERVRLKLGKEYAMGRDNASVVMVEYTDYQCPFCNSFTTTTFPLLKKEFVETGKMRFISRDYPLDFHQHALKAAQATHCAGEQEKFWQMKDALMSNYARLTPDLITSLARDVKLDVDKFQGCMESGRHVSGIKDGIAAANAIGINGTPSFVIGKVTGDQLDGYLIVGSQPFSVFENLIKKVESGTEQR